MYSVKQREKAFRQVFSSLIKLQWAEMCWCSLFSGCCYTNIHSVKSEPTVALHNKPLKSNDEMHTQNVYWAEVLFYWIKYSKIKYIRRIRFTKICCRYHGTDTLTRWLGLQQYATPKITVHRVRTELARRLWNNSTRPSRKCDYVMMNEVKIHPDTAYVSRHDLSSWLVHPVHSKHTLRKWPNLPFDHSLYYKSNAIRLSWYSCK